MKKITLAVLAISLVCLSAIISCKPAEQPKPAEQTQPAEPAKPAEAEKAKK